MPGPSRASTSRPMTEAQFLVAETAAIVSAAAVTVAFVGSFLFLLAAAVFQR